MRSALRRLIVRTDEWLAGYIARRPCATLYDFQAAVTTRRGVYSHCDHCKEGCTVPHDDECPSSCYRAWRISR